MQSIALSSLTYRSAHKLRLVSGQQVSMLETTFTKRVGAVRDPPLHFCEFLLLKSQLAIVGAIHELPLH
jgi:hypothetical protein